VCFFFLQCAAACPTLLSPTAPGPAAASTQPSTAHAQGHVTQVSLYVNTGWLRVSLACSSLCACGCMPSGQNLIQRLPRVHSEDIQETAGCNHQLYAVSIQRWCSTGGVPFLEALSRAMRVLSLGWLWLWKTCLHVSYKPHKVTRSPVAAACRLGAHRCMWHLGLAPLRHLCQLHHG
jgi:hypothetical protein